MKFCGNCKKEMADDAIFCASCGASCSSAFGTPSGTTNTTMLVWAIINIIFCSKIFGIIAMVYTLLAQNATTRAEELDKLKNAKTWNIVATAAAAFAIVLSIAVVVLVCVFSGSLLGSLINSINS
ncbi:MAG TPA: hypothetical protein PLT66_08250 [Bacillota bacterium]|nr:hypothetical protein [Bacillota bacterium]